MRKLLLLAALVWMATTSVAARADDSSVARARRVIFVTAKNCPRCDAELTRLRKPGGDFDAMRSLGWRIGAGAENHLQIVDEASIPELVAQLKVHEYPTVAAIDGSEIVRSFTSGCTTPLDAWTFGWLAKGVDERPTPMIPEAVRVASTFSYPLRGNHWSIDGDFTPSREKLLWHLRGPVHGPQIAANYAIEVWAYEELRSLHDNLHEIEMGGVQYGGFGRSAPAKGGNSFSAVSKARS
jgi:hypothetical protein